MKTTYTKRIMTLIVIISLIDLQLPFILAFFGKEQIAETLGGLIVTELIGVFLVYCAKSFFETRESENVRMAEEKLRLKEEMWNAEINK